MKKSFQLIILTSLIFFLNIIKTNSEELNQDSEIKIISRKEWEANPPLKVMKEHIPQKITIHHSGIIYKKEIVFKEKMKSLQKYSQSEEKMANGKNKEVWADIPYHFVISKSGEIAEGREIIYTGDTNTEYDPTNQILINVMGNFQEEEPTEAQLKALFKICLYLSKKYQILPQEIKGHNDYANTECPGKNLSKFVSELSEKIAQKDYN